MKKFRHIATWAFLIGNALLLTACRANLGNFFDLY
jgi:hypothetical protein